MVHNYYERQLVYHGAPTLKGIKAGSMIALKVSEQASLGDFFRKYQGLFADQGIEYIQLMRQKQHMLMLFYRPDMLGRMLRRPLARAILQEYGYSVDEGLRSMLNRLLERMEECDGFPHEIGLFLGYPPQDVQGFIEHKGHNFLFCGFWKVYANEAAVKRLFQCYNDCINKMWSRLLAGESLQEAIMAA